MMTFKTFIPLVSLFLTLMLVSTGMAQSQSDTKPDTDQKVDQETRSSYGITEADYECFKNIHCLKKNKELQQRGLHINFKSTNDYERYELRGESPNEIVYAAYDQNGNLIEGEHRRVDVAMPRFITQQLVSGPFSEWRMIGNERYIKNFDTATTQYKIIMEKDHRGTVLYFDKDGNRMNFMAEI